jgi:hypothetical protein
MAYCFSFKKWEKAMKHKIKYTDTLIYFLLIQQRKGQQIFKKNSNF